MSVTKSTAKPKAVPPKVSTKAKKTIVARPSRSKSEQKAEEVAKPLTTAQKLDVIGIDAICARIADGEDDGAIAASLEMARMSLRQWIKERGHEAAISSARGESAEAWLDKGLHTISTALRREDGIDAGAARAYAQECARRAAIRNPAYRDKQDINHGGQTDNPITAFLLQCSGKSLPIIPE